MQPLVLAVYLILLFVPTVAIQHLSFSNRPGFRFLRLRFHFRHKYDPTNYNGGQGVPALTPGWGSGICTRVRIITSDMLFY